MEMFHLMVYQVLQHHLVHAGGTSSLTSRSKHSYWATLNWNSSIKLLVPQFSYNLFLQRQPMLQMVECSVPVVDQIFSHHQYPRHGIPGIVNHCHWTLYQFKTSFPQKFAYHISLEHGQKFKWQQWKSNSKDIDPIAVRKWMRPSKWIPKKVLCWFFFPCHWPPEQEASKGTVHPSRSNFNWPIPCAKPLLFFRKFNYETILPCVRQQW